MKEFSDSFVINDLMKFTNNSPIMLAVLDVENYQIVEVNEVFLKQLDFSILEVFGKKISELNVLKDTNQIEVLTQLFYKENIIVDYEIDLVTRNGGIITCLLSIEKIFFKQNSFFLVSATNISKQKEIENKVNYLLNQQKLLSEISQILNSSLQIENVLNKVLCFLGDHTQVSRVYIFEDSEDGKTTNNTYEWCNTGIEPQINELQNFPYDLLPSWKEILEKDGCIFSENIENLPKDINDILVPQKIKSILVYPLKNNINIFGFIGFDECSVFKKWLKEDIELLRTVSVIISDAYQRRLYVKQLERKELQLNLAIESANEGLWDWDLLNNNFFFSDVFYSMLGYSKGDVNSDFVGWKSLIHPEDLLNVLEKLHVHIYGETPMYECIHRVKAKDNSWRWVLAHGMVVERNEKDVPLRAVGTYIDITKQKETEEQLKNLIATKDKLLSIISHDLRGPVNNFYLTLDHVVSKDNLTEANKHILLHELKKESEKIAFMLENLLNWAKSQSDGIKLNPTIFCINDIVEENISFLSQHAFSKSIQIKNNVDINLLVYADINTINIVLRNLMQNAVKFTPKDGFIEISATQKQDKAIVYIKDSGVGIENEFLEQILFQETFSSTHGTANEKGSGLGLVLCKDFIEKNGGELFAESEHGKGSTFFFSLPAKY